MSNAEPAPDRPPAGAAAAQPPAASLLDTIIDEGRLARYEDQRPYAKEMIGELVDGVMKNVVTVSGDTQAMINARIAEIDKLISGQLNAVIHHPEFQKLEASWRGLHYFVNRTETGEDIRVRVLNASKSALQNDLKPDTNPRFSELFKKVYEEEYGMFGGAPFGALVGDYEFSRHPQDLELLKNISNIAACAHAPFLSAASPQLFNWDDFTEMSNPTELAKIFRGNEYATWRSFRESDDARYVGLCLPHILMRLPYGKETKPVEGFNFEEDVDGKDHSKYLWGNAAYALATRLTEAFEKFHWCAAIRGVEGGGLVEGLPVHTFPSDQGDVKIKCPTEIAIPDRREKELSDLGFIPLLHCKGTDKAAFFAVQSCQKASDQWSTPQANANARLSAQLPYIMATSRVAHYLKSMMRDKIGKFMSRSDADLFLNQWIAQYVNGDSSVSQEVKAKQPLREARIDVEEVPGRPGAYEAQVLLLPHFQLDELTAALSLVAELPAPTK